MPTYGYKCPKCGHEYEAFQKMSDSNRAKCPKCGTRGERQISGGAGLVFKGSGFYITDYKRAGESKSEDRVNTEKAEKSDKAEKAGTPAKVEKSVAKPVEKPAAEKSPDKPKKKSPGAES